MADIKSSVPGREETERLVREAVVAMQSGDFAGANGIATRAIEAGAEHPFLLKVRALWLHSSGEYRDALRAFHHARSLEPNDPSILNGIAGCLAAMGEYASAIEMVEASLSLAPDAQPTHYLRGWVLEAAGELQAARQAYGRALSLAPNDPVTLAGLASVGFGLEDFDTARARAHQALALDPRQLTALKALAGADILQGKGKDAEARLRQVLQNPLPVRFRSQLLSLLGDALDVQGRCGEAFAMWQQKVDELKKGGAAAAASPLAALAASFAGTAAEAWQAAPSISGKPAPVFVTGTGSEALAPVLATLPDALRSSGGLKVLAETYLNPADGLDGLAALKGGDLDEARDGFWEGLHNPDITGKVLLEANLRYPLDLPLAAKLFPGAKVLVVVRDPRDAVFEAFRHQAGSDEAGSDTYTLAECAKSYAEVLAFAGDCRGKLPLTFRDLRYEELTGDYDNAVRGVLDFAGVAVPAELPALTRRAKQSAGAWRRYAEQMAPALAILAPWVAKLGYHDA